MAVGGALTAVALAALVGLGLASALWGRGWVWPYGTETVTHVLGGLLSGDPGHGLPPDQLRQVAGPVPVYACVAVVESALVAAAVITTIFITRYRRPGDARSGMASRSEAERALGLRELRTARAVIRPDLYRPGADRLSTSRATAETFAHRSVTGRLAQPAYVAPSASTRPTHLEEFSS